MKDDALYLEADEDITSAIDKLHKSTAAAVQIVVPKRSTMLQSIINLKLLKKAAESAGKELVLVTNDRVASDLAGRVGLAVAPSLGAKAVIAATEVPKELARGEEVIEADDPDPAQAVPPPAVTSSPKSASKRPPLLKRREVSDGPPAPPPGPDLAAAVAGGAAGAAASASDTASSTTDAASAAKPRGPKVPNFGRLQRRVMWLGLAAVLVVGYFVGMYFLTSAKITLYANGSRTDVDTTFAVDTSVSANSNAAGGVLAGQTVTVSKDLSGPFTPTGKQDAGTKAGGTITISNSYDENSHTFAAGTIFIAPDNNQFMSTGDVTVPGATLGLSGGHVSLNPGTASVSVQAAANGDSYNEAAATYTIHNLPAAEQGSGGITARGGQMSGGTTKTITIAQQSDVTGEQASLLAADQNNISGDLKSKVPAGYTALAGSQATAVSGVTPNPAVGAAGSTGTLQIHVTYTELAVKQADYQALINALEQKQIGASNQIYDNGISSAQVTMGNKDASGRQSFNFTTEAYSGAKLDTAAIAKQLAGKRYGDAANIAQGLPGVTQANINITPSWSGSMPKRTGNITIKIQVAKQ